MSPTSFFATAAFGLTAPLADELRRLALADVVETTGGVAFTGDLDDGYRAMVESRIASRILLRLHTFVCADRDQLYAGVRAIDWPAQMTSTTTFVVNASRGRDAAPALHHTHYIALHIKDAIVDAFRDAGLDRPSVDLERPGLRLHLHLEGDQASLFLDLAGPLHERGYRDPGALAPVRETLAAGILALAGYDGTKPLCDPFCGSGTLAIEAAMIAADIPPGALRAPPILGWRGHHAGKLAARLTAARARQKPDPATPVLFASDIEPSAVASTQAAVARLGLARWIAVERADALFREPPVATPGLVVTNLPYGERVGAADLELLQEQFGNQLRRRYLGWNTFLLVGDERHGAAIGLKPKRRHVLFNGPIECRLLELPISDRAVVVDNAPGWQTKRDEEGEAFGNRLRKNIKHLGKWRKRENVSCYRAYDADIPEFAVAVDVYEGEVVLSEYAYPSTVDEGRAQARLRAAVSECAKTFAISTDRVHVKERRRHNRGEQYQRQERTGETQWIKENGLEFMVNLVDYLDTGIYLDQRKLRARLEAEAKDKRFLNLFAYTCTASVYAARGGAWKTTSVDLSNTYLEWGLENFGRNNLQSERNRVVKADVITTLAKGTEPYDLIFCSPPSFSNSKSMEGSFDIQRDHGPLVIAMGKRLAPGGTIYFSTHRERFKLDEAAVTEANLVATDITHETMSPDYARRDPKFHRTFRLVGTRTV